MLQVKKTVLAKAQAGACLERAERGKEGNVPEPEGIREDEAKRQWRTIQVGPRWSR